MATRPPLAFPFLGPSCPPCGGPTPFSRAPGFPGGGRLNGLSASWEGCSQRPCFPGAQGFKAGLWALSFPGSQRCSAGGGPLAGVTSWSLPLPALLRLGSVSFRWSSRWLLPFPEKQALAGLEPAALKPAARPRASGAIGSRWAVSASPAPPVLPSATCRPGACPQSALGLTDWREEEAAEKQKNTLFLKVWSGSLNSWAARSAPPPAPLAADTPPPPTPGEMLSRG